MITTEEKIAVMTAYAEGKEVEFLSEIGRWLPASNPLWNWETTIYRVKPEPKYRPYANAEECYKDVVKHGGWVKNTSGQYINVIAVFERSMAYADNISLRYEKACSHWVWADDATPCGVLEE